MLNRKLCLAWALLLWPHQPLLASQLPEDTLSHRYGAGPVQLELAEGEYAASFPLRDPETRLEAIAAIILALKLNDQHAMHLGDDLGTHFENPPRLRDWWALALAEMTGHELHIATADLPVVRDERIDLLLGEVEQGLIK